MTSYRRFGSFIWLASIVLSSFSLSGCGVIRDRSGDYVNERNGDGIIVAPWFRQDSVQDSYPVPEISNNQILAQNFNLPAPPDATLRILKEQFSVELQDDQVWLLVNEPPSRVWPGIERFLLSRGVVFTHSNPQLGLAQAGMDSSSVLARQLAKDIGLNAEQSHIVQIRVNQGLKKNSAEVQMRILPDDDSLDFKAWRGDSNGLLIEKALLEKTKEHMLAHKDDKSFSLLASDIGGPSKVSLIANSDADSYLKLDLDFDRSWSVVLRAIKNANLPVADMDRSLGLIYLDVADNDDKCGFLSWFCSADKGKPEYDYKVDLKIIDDFVKVYVSSMIDPADIDGQAKILALLLESAS
jgi:outer membrane protein assembly factor BamC